MLGGKRPSGVLGRDLCGGGGRRNVPGQKCALCFSCLLTEVLTGAVSLGFRRARPSGVKVQGNHGGRVTYNNIIRRRRGRAFFTLPYKRSWRTGKMQKK